MHLLWLCSTADVVPSNKPKKSKNEEADTFNSRDPLLATHLPNY